MTTATTIDEAAARYASGPEGRTAIMGQARDENRARKAALVAGEPVPATPALDFINSPEAKAKSSRASASRAPSAVPSVRLFRRGTPMADRHNSLSALAFQATRGVDGRWSTQQLRDWLAKEGVDSPLTTAWERTLPNGVVIGARLMGDPTTTATRTTTKTEPATPGKAEPVPARRRGTKAAPAKKAATPRKRATKVA